MVTGRSRWKKGTGKRQPSPLLSACMNGIGCRLGFVGSYRRFIKGFSAIAKLLNGLLVGTGHSRGRRSPSIVWSPECAAAFEQLKQELLKAPILAYADFTKPFIVYTDASNCGLGAVLAQQQNRAE